MKHLMIQDAEALVVKAPLVSPFRISTGQHNELENVFFQIRASDRIKGFGEAAVATHITGETIPQTLSNLKNAAGRLAGREITDYKRLCAEFRPLFEGNHAGLAAFEMAILDAVTQYQGIPLWRLFGPRPRKFATDITIVIGTLEEAVGGTSDFYQRGFRSFKIKIGRDEREDFLRVQAVAKLAPRAAIILDANQAYDARRMLRFLASLKTARITPRLLEQPVPKDDWAGLAKLTRESGVLVCADESVKSLADAKKACRTKAVSAINIKTMKSGMLEGAEIAHLGKKHGMRLMIGAMMESTLSITASAHMTAGLGCFDFVDLDTTFFVKGPLSRSPYLDCHGHFDLAKAKPGIGIRFPQLKRNV